MTTLIKTQVTEKIRFPFTPSTSRVSSQAKSQPHTRIGTHGRMTIGEVRRRNLTTRMIRERVKSSARENEVLPLRPRSHGLRSGNMRSIWIDTNYYPRFTSARRKHGVSETYAKIIREPQSYSHARYARNNRLKVTD